ncbi:MAG: hypothetical protein M1457_03605 [bacterium]|nr:hypothetical protein [bacterium]
MAKHLYVYSAEAQTRHLTDVFRAMFHGFVNARYIAYRLFVKDLRSEYAHSAFGMVWDFLDPLVLALVFYALMNIRVINPGEMGMPYAVYVVFGAMLYQTFMESVTMPLEIVRKSRNLLTHLKVSPEVLMTSVFFRIVFNSLFRIMVMLLVSLFLLPTFHVVGFLKFTVLFPAIIAAGLPVGILLAPFNTIYSDVGRVTRIILNPIRYATPVMYTLPHEGIWVPILTYNPVAAILTSLRSLATLNTWEDPRGFAVWLLIHLGLFCAGWFIFHISIPVLAEKV